nr:RNA-dependent RNA polymerase [Mute swan feces associated picorna-like virus 19]
MTMISSFLNPKTRPSGTSPILKWMTNARVYLRGKTRKRAKRRKYEKKDQSIYDWMIHGSKNDQINKHRIDEIILRDEFYYWSPHARQLGVGYSSNNAGDGPESNGYEILDVNFIYGIQTLFDLRDGDIIETDDYFILFTINPIPRIIIQIYNGRNLDDLHTYLFGDTKQLQSTDYRPYLVCFSWLTIILDNLDDIKKRIGDADVYANIERIMYFGYDLIRAKDLNEVAFAIGRAVSTLMDGQLTRRFAENISTAIDIIFDIDLQSSDDENIFQKIRHVLDNYTMFKDSPLVKKLHKFVMYILSFFLFKDPDFAYGSFGYTKLETELLQKQYSSKGDFAFTIVDTITFLCEKGYQIYKDGYSSSIFHSSDKYVDFHKRCCNLIERSAFINQTEALDENSFLAELDDLLEKGTDILKCAKLMSRFDASIISRYVNQLRSIRLDILTFRGATKARKAPFGMLLFGNSGIGKTSLTRILIKQFCNVNDLEDEDEYIYFRNYTEEFWNNFRTCMHTLVLDDISNEHPNLGDPKSVNEIIGVMNDANFVPNQAALEDKGRIPLRCKLVVATTNVKSLNAHAYFSCPSAVQRRFPYIITPTVKPEYVDPQTGMLDPSRVPVVPKDSFDDLWYLKIEKVKTQPIDTTRTIQAQATFEVIHEGLEMPEFISWYTNAINDFNNNQNIVEKAVDNIRKTKACGVCKLPLAYCKCQLQSIEVELLKFAWLSWCHTLFCDMFSAIILVILPYFGFGNYTFDTFTYFLRNPALARKFFSNLGMRACERYGRPKYLVGIPAAVAVIVAAYKMYQSTQELQGNNQSKNDKVGTKPVPSEVDKRDPVWYNDKFELTPADVSRSTLSSKGNVDTIKRLFAANCVFIRSKIDKEYTRPSKAFCIGGQLYITNNHSLPYYDLVEITLTQQSAKQGVTSNISFTLSKCDICRMPEKDLCCFIVRNLPPKRDLTQYFCEPSFKANTHAFYFGKNEDGSIYDKPVINIKHVTEFTPALIKAVGYIPRVSKWVGYVDEPTTNGDCGSVLVSESHYGYCIVGVHMQGSGDIVAASALDSSVIKELQEWGKRYFIDVSPPILQSQNHKAELVSLHPKSCLRYIEKGHANVFGSFAGFRPKSKSKVENTLMSEVVKSFGYVERFGKPVFGWKPYRLAALDCLNIPYKVDTNILDICTQSFVRDIKIKLPKEQLANLHVYDDFTVINGAAGVNYVDKIVRNTSAGFPFRKSKKHFMFAIPPQHDLQDPVDVTDEIKEIYFEILERYRQGKTSGSIFTAHLKDEPVSFAKQEAGKTRVFSGANLPWSMVVRKYLLSFIRVMQENRYLFEAAPGIVAQGPEWEQLHKYVVAHGRDKIVAGDYGKFDKRMLAAIITSAFTFMHDICEYSGNYTPEDLRVVKAIGFDVAFSLQDFNGDLIQLFGSNPSGHPLTVIVNCIVNSLYIRYAYYMENPDKECDTFKQNVNLMTYGDDNIMGVSDDIPWFNHTVISARLADIGVVYTMPDKTSESVPYINIDDASFLKRTWRMEETVNKHMAPLDEESIEKMLLTWVRSKSITEQEQAIAVLSSANREYFFYGKDIFEKKQKMFKEIVTQCNLERFVEDSTLPTYEKLMKEYNSRLDPEA